MIRATKKKKTKAEQDKDIWSCWGWMVCHFKQGGQVSFIEEAIFYIKLRGGKRVIIHASIEEGELSGRRKKMTACLVGLRNRKETMCLEQVMTSRRYWNPAHIGPGRPLKDFGFYSG